MKLKLRGETFDFFNNVSIDLRFDSVASSFSFNAIFDYNNEKHRKLFRPFSYAPVQIYSNNGDLLITGTILNHTFVSSATPSLANLSGYSKTGILEDCAIPLDLYPLQFDNLTLREITEKLISRFGIKLVVDGTAQSDVNTVFTNQTASNTESIKSFLTKIASQKNIILSHNEFGNLVYTKGRTFDNPITTFSTSDGTATRITLGCNGQAMHSEIVTQKQASIETDNSAEETINNPFVSIFRPITKIQTSGDDNETKSASENILGSELKNISLTIETDRLEWVLAGKFETIQPNRIVSVIAPECAIYKKTNFFIESVTLTGDETKDIAVIKCVLPQVYNGKTPKNIFI